MPKCYDYDYHWLRKYVQTCNYQDQDFLKEFWHKEVGETKDDWDYLERKVGWDTLLDLVSDPEYHYSPEFDRFGPAKWESAK